MFILLAIYELLQQRKNDLTVGIILDENLLDAAIAGKDILAVNKVGTAEGVNPNFLLRQIALGHVVIMQRFGEEPIGIGYGLKTKINANIGSSTEIFDPDDEVEKAKVAERYGADTITDLSMGGPIDEIRRRISEETTVPLTTVPIYQTVVETGSFEAVTENDLLRMIRKHVVEGISSIVIHAGFTMEMLEELRGLRRIMGLVSKGGSFTAAWMLRKHKENPFLSQFDEICKILAEKDVVLSLGNTMRSGCIHDIMDGPQNKEIGMNAKLAKHANMLGVQVIIEGMGGHISPDKIPIYVNHHKAKTDHRPLFVAGPLPIDIGVGYDHISGCVGGALAAGAGADYLCYITPSEHLALPNANQVRDGVVAFKIAAHIGDTLKYGLRPEDKNLAEYRKAKDWENQFLSAIDGNRAKEIHLQDDTKTCSMCGKYCAISLMEDYLN
ncbi:MAG: phosphomethylpyrimidine synthase ThiC [Methanotrichaceae archaeon]|nr:phosphomethylpyrimidine synthase ThiC [Methanotrichaceae archaeon]